MGARLEPLAHVLVSCSPGPLLVLHPYCTQAAALCRTEREGGPVLACYKAAAVASPHLAPAAPLLTPDGIHAVCR